MATKPPQIVAACDDAAWKPNPDGPRGTRSRAECRDMAEGIFCSQPQNLGDPWCKEQRARRIRDRQILMIGAAVLVALVYLDE